MKNNTKTILLFYSSFTTATTTVTNITNKNNNNNNKRENHFIKKVGVHRESTGSPHIKKGERWK
jgi:hypothetical protein